MDLEAAVKNQLAGFSIRYQPQVRAETFQLTGGGPAPVRLPTAGVPPAEVVPIWSAPA